jgi:hypothetical protein
LPRSSIDKDEKERWRGRVKAWEGRDEKKRARRGWESERRASQRPETRGKIWIVM